MMTTAAAAAIVVRSNGPSAPAFPVGKSLPSGAAIVLKTGDVITVLDAGGTRVLRGPGRLSVAGTGAASVNGIAALIADTGARQSRTGATRGSNAGPVHPTNLWYLDVARGGNVCVDDAAALALWRTPSDQPAVVTITPSGGAPLALPFRAGQAVAPWPGTALPVRDGASFRIQRQGVGQAPIVTITMRMLPAHPAGLDAAATALLDHGCSAQVDTLVAATTVDPGS